MHTIETAKKVLASFLEHEKLESSPLAVCLHDVIKIAEDMEKDVEFLGCLNAAGVDNWDGYEQAQEMFDNL